jgi:hypothetical protein
MWIARLVRRSLDDDFDGDMVRLRAKTLGTARDGGPYVGGGEIRILRDGKPVVAAIKPVPKEDTPRQPD